MSIERDFYEEVRKTAYDLYCRRGMAHAHDLEDWLEAESIVSGQYAGDSRDGESGGKALRDADRHKRHAVKK